MRHGNLWQQMVNPLIGWSGWRGSACMRVVLCGVEAVKPEVSSAVLCFIAAAAAILIFKLMPLYAHFEFWIRRTSDRCGAILVH